MPQHRSRSYNINIYFDQIFIFYFQNDYRRSACYLFKHIGSFPVFAGGRVPLYQRKHREVSNRLC